MLIELIREYSVSSAKYEYPRTLANSTLIILFSKMLKFSNFISFKSKNILKDNSEYLGIFHLLKWIWDIGSLVLKPRVYHLIFIAPTIAHIFFIGMCARIRHWN
jgi:hypothetical protein